jgi:hypothetical protein
MKKAIAAAVILGCGVVLAQVEDVPRDRAQKFGGILVQTSAEFENLAIKIEADAQKTHAIKSKAMAALIIPDRKFSEDRMKSVDKEIVPVGQLWLLKMAPAKDGKITAEEKLRMVSVKADKEEHQLSLYLLGLRKTEDGRELLVYAKGKEPLLTLAVTKAAETQDLPLRVSGEKAGDNTGRITINLLGKHKADFLVMPKD